MSVSWSPGLCSINVGSHSPASPRRRMLQWGKRGKMSGYMKWLTMKRKEGREFSGSTFETTRMSFEMLVPPRRCSPNSSELWFQPAADIPKVVNFLC